MACCSVDISLTNLVLLVGLYYIVKKAWEFYKTWKTEKLLEKYNNTPKDKVILHAVPRGKTLPSISPYCLKLETFLRMAKIPYEFDPKDPMGAKGKSPWITYNGTHVADSHLAMQFLKKKLNPKLNEKVSKEQLAVSTSVRVMLENHCVMGLASWRWVENLSAIKDLMKIPMSYRPFFSFLSRRIKKSLETQGFGLHTLSEQHEMASDDLVAASNILGSKPFFGGDVPCEEDCAIFGVLSQMLWAAPGSPYEKLIEKELVNLKQYCERMKNTYWSDWMQCLDHSTD